MSLLISSNQTKTYKASCNTAPNLLCILTSKYLKSPPYPLIICGHFRTRYVYNRFVSQPKTFMMFQLSAVLDGFRSVSTYNMQQTTISLLRNVKIVFLRVDRELVSHLNQLVHTRNKLNKLKSGKALTQKDH